MTSLESLVEHYGYAVLLVGTFLEGETILVIAGFAAHRGYLSLPWVMVVAFVGSLAGDQLWFHLGRRNRAGLLARRPHWAARAERLRNLLARFDTLFVLGFRFLYGLRTITPLVLGAGGYDPRRFALLNAGGAALWSVAVACAGYAFGHALTLVVEDVKRYERLLAALLIAFGAAAWFWRRMNARRRKLELARSEEAAPIVAERSEPAGARQPRTPIEQPLVNTPPPSRSPPGP